MINGVTVNNLSWKPLESAGVDRLWRGTVFRFPARHPYEDVVEFMLVDPHADHGRLGLLVATGYHAGELVQILPSDAFVMDARAISRAWLAREWKTWVYAECEFSDVEYLEHYVASERGNS